MWLTMIALGFLGGLFGFLWSRRRPDRWHPDRTKYPL